jgi:LysM repeat protein
MICCKKFLYLFACVFFFLSASAQQKSENVTTVDGKKYYVHKIGKKQSLYSISKLYGVSLDEIYVLNPGVRNGTKTGEEIRIPFTSTLVPLSYDAIDTTKYFTHKVAKGETQYALQQRFSLTEKQLIQFNPTIIQGLKEGQVIVTGEKNKKKPAKEKEIKYQPVTKEKAVPLIVDSTLFVPVSKPRKQVYKIALMLPFHLENSAGIDVTELARSRSNFPSMPALSMDFYLGFKKACDSLADAGFSVVLMPYDIDEKDSLKLIITLADQGLRQCDMIVGPLHANGFRTVAGKAREWHIPIVNPVTQQNKILFNNIYVSKTNPSQFTLMESLADYCMDSLITRGARLILVAANEKDKKEAGFVAAFRKYYNDKQLLRGALYDTVTLARGGFEGVKKAYTPNVRNIVVSLSSHQVFIADFTTQLSLFSEKKDIMLCGWQATTEMDNIDQEYLNMLGYTFPSQFDIRSITSATTLSHWYAAQQQTFPGEYFFSGFHIGMYYAKKLKETGPDFVHNLEQYREETPYMYFKFARPDRSTGFDNRGVFVFRYQDYRLRKTGWR